MNKTSKVSATLVLLGAAFLLTAACSAAKPDRPAPTTTATTARAHIILYNINSDGPYYRAIVTGTIGDFGPAIAVYPDGKVDPQHNSEMELKLQAGSFRLDIAGIEKAFFAHVESQPAYSRTCSRFQNFASTAPIVAGSGTGAYRGISGSFDIEVTAGEVQSKPCTPPIGKPPLREVIVLAGDGTITQ